MRALRFHGKKDIRLDDVPPPQCLPTQVRIKVAFYGICGTDLHKYLDGPVLLPAEKTVNEHTGARLPLIMGHEMSGVVREVGSRFQGIHVGQRVPVKPAMGCRHHGVATCELCVSGRQNIYTRSTFYGLQAPNGGLADKICVDALAIVPIPDQVSLKLAALAEPLAVAAHMVRVSGIHKEQTAIVFGAGPIGCALTMFLKDAGVKHVLVSEVVQSRASQALACGADNIVDPSSHLSAVIDAVSRVMAPGADVAFDACGLQVTLDEAFRCTKPGGTVFNVAIHERPLSLNLNLLTLSEKKLMAGNAYTKVDYEKVVALLQKRPRDIEKFITAIVSLEEAVDQGFCELIQNKAKHNKILVRVQREDDVETVRARI